MIAFLARRLMISLITLLGVSIILFVLIRVVPGDPSDAILGQFSTPEQAERINRAFRLDQSLPVQYAVWFRGAVRGDLGPSSLHDRPVSEVIREALPATAQLATMALGFGLALGVPLGVLAAIRQGRLLDYLCSSIGVLGVSIPNFWLATLLLLAFAFYWPIMPAGGVPPFTQDPVGNLVAMVMPTIALGLAVAAVIMRMTRSAMLEVIAQDYIRTARAKGLAPRVVIMRHALRNALAPVLTITGIQAGYLLGGSVIIEQVFRIRGIGWLVIESATGRDYFLLQAVVLLIAIAFILINLAVDLVYGVVDPRMRR